MKKIPKKIREKVIKRDAGLCVICGNNFQHIHHIYGRNSYIPAFFGLENIKGNNNVENLVCVCAFCHQKLHLKKNSNEEKEKLLERNIKKGGSK